MKLFLMLLSLIAVVITFGLGLKKELFFLGLFAASPYVLSFVLLQIAKERTALITAEVLSLFIVSVGLYFLLDTTYMEKNLGLKFSYLFIPIWQLTMLVVVGAVVYLSNGSSTVSSKNL